jgi:hypothetical protein
VRLIDQIEDSFRQRWALADPRAERPQYSLGGWRLWRFVL